MGTVSEAMVSDHQPIRRAKSRGQDKKAPKPLVPHQQQLDELKMPQPPAPDPTIYKPDDEDDDEKK